MSNDQTSDFLKKSDVSDPGADYCIPDAHGRCITCSDELQRATVLAVDAALLMAQADIDGEYFDIDVTLVGDVKQGDVLLVHGGVALERAYSDLPNRCTNEGAYDPKRRL